MPRTGNGAAPKPHSDHSDRIVRALRILVRALSAQSRELASESGVTVLELLCLRRVCEMGRSTAAEVARDVHMSAAKVVGVMDRLEEKGLVGRKRNPDGRRHMSYDATDSGRERYDSVRYPVQMLFDARDPHVLEEADYERIATALEDLVGAIGAKTHDGDTPLTSIGPVDPGRDT
jgi:DNA-binding MarR family transcriptional regulator